jgi:hypothetical protein
VSAVDYIISQEMARQIAVGIYRSVGKYVTAAKQDFPEKYENFKTDFFTRQNTKISASEKPQRKKSQN